MNYCEFSFKTTSVNQCEILIAQLSNLGFEGFEEADAVLKACIKEEELDRAAVDAIAAIAAIAKTDYTILVMCSKPSFLGKNSTKAPNSLMLFIVPS